MQLNFKISSFKISVVTIILKLYNGEGMLLESGELEIYLNFI